MVSLSCFQPSPGSSQPNETDTRLDGSENDRHMHIDIVFLQDTTGSQGPYINSAKKAIRDICNKISASADIKKEFIRFGLIAFRDHPPQDDSYVTKLFGLTNDISVMQTNLNSLIASGGGDGPEAQTAALAAALNMDWSDNAVKMVVLITDSPPHGVEKSRDGFTESPDQNDPLDMARQMAEHGITLFVIACEPSLSGYDNAVDFYTALTRLTNGNICSLMMADKLGDYIAGTAVETIETEKIIKEFEHIIIDDIYGAEIPIEKVTNDLQGKLHEKGSKMNTMAIDTIYNETAETRANINIWYTSKNIADARQHVSLSRTPRMKAQYASGARKPATSLNPQATSESQAWRVVDSSLGRNSEVTHEGMFSRKYEGKSASSTYRPY